MIFIKRLALVLSMVCMVSAPGLVAISSVSAADVLSHCGEGSANGSPDVCNDAGAQSGNLGDNPIIGIIKAAIEVLSFIIGVAAIIGIIVSGIRLMMAGGDSNAIASARGGIIYSLIGIAVAVLAQVLVAFVLDNVK